MTVLLDLGLGDQTSSTDDATSQPAPEPNESSPINSEETSKQDEDATKSVVAKEVGADVALDGSAPHPTDGAIISAVNNEEKIIKKDEDQNESKSIDNVGEPSKSNTATFVLNPGSASQKRTTTAGEAQSTEKGGRQSELDDELLQFQDDEDSTKKSPSMVEWQRWKQTSGVANSFLDNLMKLAGFEDSKEFFLDVFWTVEESKRLGTPMHKETFDVAILGKPGTGIIEIAKLYAGFLESLGIISKSVDYEIHDAVRASEGFGKFPGQYMREIVEKERERKSGSIGCAIIVSNIHALRKFQPEFNHFLAFAKENYGSKSGQVVLILCGEPKGTTAMLEDPDLVIQPPHTIKVSGFTEDQMLNMLADRITRRFGGKATVEGGLKGPWARALCRRARENSKGQRCDSSQDSTSPADILHLEFLLRSAYRRQAKRLRTDHRARQSSNLCLTKGDLLGEIKCPLPGNIESWKELEKFVGMTPIKDVIAAVRVQHIHNMMRVDEGLEKIPIPRNWMILGPPGTGKTTGATLFGQIYAKLGILSKGHVVRRTSQELIGQYLGETEVRTREALYESKGGVLVLDDFHVLDPGERSSKSFKREALDTLVAEVQNKPNEDRVIILCGYSDPVEELMQRANPGLSLRFPLGRALHLPNYTLDELEKILERSLEQSGVKQTSEGKAVALSMLDRATMRPNFGNATEVGSLVEQAMMNYNKRTHKKSPTLEPLGSIILLPDDYDPNHDRISRAVENCAVLFQGLEGYDRIVSQFQNYQQTVTGMKLFRIDPRPHIPFRFVFRGPPGTGKTTTARKLGHIFYDMGFLSAPVVVECSVSELISAYEGQSGKTVASLLERSIGKVLFIDEAYRLCDSGMAGREVVAELVDCITKPRFLRTTIIILAGYHNDMERLMNSNEGLRSRFATDVLFHPMGPENCVRYLKRCLREVRIETSELGSNMEDTAAPIIQALMKLCASKNWANGRSIEMLADRIMRRVFVARALSGDVASPLTVSVKDTVLEMEDMIIASMNSPKYTPLPSQSAWMSLGRVLE